MPYAGDQFRCKYCNYAYSSQGFLRRHLINGCDYLKKSSSGRQSSARVPIKRKNVPKNHKCPMCFQLFKSRETLVSHLRDTCGQLPKYKCPYCDLKSKRPHNIKAHVRNKHEGQAFYLINISSEYD